MSADRGSAALAEAVYRPSRISSRLWQGAAPPEGRALADARVDVLVLAAAEHQVPADRFPGVEILHAGIGDEERPPSAREAAIVEVAAGAVASALNAGKRVLVTCWQGRNRSGVIVARALMLRSGLRWDRAVRVVRANRDPSALSNPYFVRYLAEADRQEAP